MKPKVIVLGPKSGIGEAILFKLKKNCKNFNFFSVVRKPTVQSDEIFWDYQSDLPHDFRKSFLVINCARSDDFLYNINFNRILDSKEDIEDLSGVDIEQAIEEFINSLEPSNKKSIIDYTLGLYESCKV